MYIHTCIYIYIYIYTDTYAYSYTYRYASCICVYISRSPCHYPKYDDDVCSKLFLSQEQKSFRSCCPQGLRVIVSAKADRNLTTTHKGANFGRNIVCCVL